jgi:putative transposase
VAGSKMLTGTGEDALLLAFAPFDVAEMDAHKVDMIGTVGIPAPNGCTLWIPVQRIQILLIADAKSTAVLGFYVAIRRECNKTDVLAAALPMVKPWQPRQLCVAGMTYEEGSGLPSGVIDGLAPYGICSLLVDNALINISEAVVDRIVGRLGCSLNWGPVRKWMRRAIVERVFRSLEQAGFQRIVSTTGSNPSDPRRDKPVKAAVKHRLSLAFILDLIDIEIARYNNRSSEGLYGLSPLEVLRQTVCGTGGRTLIPRLPPVPNHMAELDRLVFKKRITGNLKKGRRPVIRFERARYTNRVIAGTPQLIGEPVIVHCRENDIRTIDVFLAKDGSSLGTASAQAPWNVEPHSLELRRQIFREVDDARIRDGEHVSPVALMHRMLARRALKQHNPRNPKISRDATMLARESNSTGMPIDQMTKEPDSPPLVPFVGSSRAPKFRHRVKGNG